MKRYNRDLNSENSYVSLWHMFAAVDVGNALLRAHDANQNLSYYADQNPAAIHDAWHHRIYLKSGTYTLTMLYLKTIASGKLTLKLVHVPSGEVVFSPADFDFYNGTTVYNEYAAMDMLVKRDGLYDLTGSIDSKNASSTNYVCALTLIHLAHQG